MPPNIWDRIQPCPVSGCWTWTGRYSKDGPKSLVRFWGATRTPNRAIYEALIEPIAVDVRLWSRCDHTCCNPQHMTTSACAVEVVQSKSCKSCGVIKPASEFRAGKRYLASSCRECRKLQAQVWRAADPKRYREAGRRQTKRKRDRLIAQLGPASLCQICGCAIQGEGRGRKGAHFDHNHQTGAARGWLCHLCNTGLGLLGDNPRILDRAAEYLRTKGHAATRPVIK